MRLLARFAQTVFGLFLAVLRLSGLRRRRQRFFSRKSIPAPARVAQIRLGRVIALGNKLLCRAVRKGPHGFGPESFCPTCTFKNGHTAEKLVGSQAKDRTRKLGNGPGPLLLQKLASRAFAGVARAKQSQEPGQRFKRAESQAEAGSPPGPAVDTVGGRVGASWVPCGTPCHQDQPGP